MRRTRLTDLGIDRPNRTAALGRPFIVRLQFAQAAKENWRFVLR